MPKFPRGWRNSARRTAEIEALNYATAISGDFTRRTVPEFLSRLESHCSKLDIVKFTHILHATNEGVDSALGEGVPHKSGC